MRKRVQLHFNDESLTHQSFKDECDINNIVKKYKRTGIVTHVTSKVSRYDDLSDVPTFHEAMNIVASATQEFEQLPAALRKRFANDPAQFLDFVHDPKNVPEMRELGLLNPEVSAPNVAPLQGLDSNNTTAESGSTSGVT